MLFIGFGFVIGVLFGFFGMGVLSTVGFALIMLSALLVSGSVIDGTTKAMRVESKTAAAMAD
ncbi:hypothetical protein [Natronorubrum bangense]|nr:hypothetical protein [Natronorubrum bangense]ELY47070.1 hypothetical protein C494_13501 [Natronorubrum bangense JCM 10635]